MFGLTQVVEKAPAGAMIEYHRGNLAIDRGSPKPVSAAEEFVNAVANEAWSLYEQGAVLLVQKRSGWLDYSYMAVVRQRPGHRA